MYKMYKYEIVYRPTGIPLVGGNDEKKLREMIEEYQKETGDKGYYVRRKI